MNTILNPSDRRTNQQRVSFTLALPYEPSFYKKCTHLLKHYYVRTVPIVNHGLKSVIKLGKDKCNKDDTPNVVYQFDCRNNQCQRIYLGQTKRPLHVRVGEHKNNKNKKSVVTKHKNANCDFDWAGVKILDRENNRTKRRFSEMLHIIASDNEKILNEQKDTKDLSRIYRCLTKNIR